MFLHPCLGGVLWWPLPAQQTPSSSQVCPEGSTHTGPVPVGPQPLVLTAHHPSVVMDDQPESWVPCALSVSFLTKTQTRCHCSLIEFAEIKIIKLRKKTKILLLGLGRMILVLCWSIGKLEWAFWKQCENVSRTFKKFILFVFLMGWIVSPRDIHPGPEPVSVTLFRNRVFADVS